MASVGYQINGADVTTPTRVRWERVSLGQNLDGTARYSQYWRHTWERELMRGDNLDWLAYENAVLTSIRTVPPDDPSGDTQTTYTDVVMGGIDRRDVEGRNLANVSVTFWVEVA